MVPSASHAENCELLRWPFIAAFLIDYLIFFEEPLRAACGKREEGGPLVAVLPTPYCPEQFSSGLTLRDPLSQGNHLIPIYPGLPWFYH